MKEDGMGQAGNKKGRDENCTEF